MFGRVLLLRRQSMLEVGHKLAQWQEVEKTASFLTMRGLTHSLHTTCVKSTVLYGSETWVDQHWCG